MAEQQIAKLNFLRIAPRKVRSVAGLLRGLSVNEAEAQLLVQPRRAAQPLLKLLRSAVAGAKNNKHLNPDKLFVKILKVDQGPMMKRSLPRARGMATMIQKKMSHVTLVLEEKSEMVNPRFKIVVKKKVKLPKEESPKIKAKRDKPGIKEDRVIEPRKKEKNSGFFKKVFSRKSGM